MSDTRNPTIVPARGAAALDSGLRAFLLGIYTKLGLGLALAGAVAWTVGNVPEVTQLLLRVTEGRLVGYTPLGLAVLFAPLVLLLGATFLMRKPTPGATALLYWTITALIGASLGTLFFLYTGGSLVSTFFVTAAAFGALALAGYVTKRSLQGFGAFLTMGLFGLILAMLANLFLRNGALYFITNVVGVLIFAGLIAWDSQRLKLLYAELQDDAVSMAIATNFGALSLFIDFINLFQFLLALTGQRSNR
jgi:FtsH-binding integral membrane protein